MADRVSPRRQARRQKRAEKRASRGKRWYDADLPPTYRWRGDGGVAT